MASRRIEPDTGAGKAASQQAAPMDGPAFWVCLALLLALVCLAARVAGRW